MSRSHRRAAAIAAVLLLSAPVAEAQQDEHAAHHPPGASAATPAPPPAAAATPPSPQTTPGSEGMGGMMMDCEGCMRPPQGSLYARLLALPHVSDAERHAIADEGRRRMTEGSALLEQAAKEAQWGASMHDPVRLEQAKALAREGESLLQSGAAAHLALARGAQGGQVGLDWFRREMSLAPPPHGPASFWAWDSPGHLVLMTVLALLAAALLALAWVRNARARDVLAAAQAGRSAAPERAASSPGAPAGLLPATVAPGPVGPGAAPDTPRKPWRGELRVAQIVRETPSTSTLRLVEPSGGRLPFDFLPGQFMQVEVSPDGGAAKRSYTIASPPTRTGHLELTVKREDQGVVSRFLHEQVKVGDRLKVAGPYGAFTFSGTDADSIVLIAGGVGVTPMMSVLRYLTDIVWPGQIFFIYSARSTEEMLFRGELEAIETQHPNVNVLCTVATRTPGTSWLGPEGMLTRELLQGAVPELGRRRIHLCGPPNMMAAVKALLTELGAPAEQIRTEAFGPASLPVQEPAPEDRAAPRPAAKPVDAAVAPQTITFSVAGVSAPLRSETTVLEAAEAAGVEIPYSCRSGVCGLCVVKLKQGAVSMDVEEGLDPADKAKGFVLACQAKSTGGDLVVEA